MTDKNLATTQNVVRLRQSFNQYSKNWSVPKRLVDGKWVPVSKDRLKHIVKVDGYRYALWRMRDTMIKIKDDHGRPVWRVNSISKQHVTYGDVTYSVFQFDCHRIAHGIIGGMNTVGGAK
jgi:hypothetical protein